MTLPHKLPWHRGLHVTWPYDDTAVYTVMTLTWHPFLRYTDNGNWAFSPCPLPFSAILKFFHKECEVYSHIDRAKLFQWPQDPANPNITTITPLIKPTTTWAYTVSRIVEPFHCIGCVTQDHNIYVVDFFDRNTPTFAVEFSDAQSGFFRRTKWIFLTNNLFSDKIYLSMTYFLFWWQSKD
jgi:hypothetical protein